MRKEKTTMVEAAKDALLGYTAVTLGIGCFFVAMWALIAVVRLILIGQ